MKIKTTSLKLALATALCLGAMSSIAVAETTRTEYVETVEPICKVNSEANDRILKGVRKLVNQGKLKVAGAKFLKASAALNKAYAQIAAVEKPAADASRLTQWLAKIKKQVGLLKTIGLKLKAGKKGAASSLVVKLKNEANAANILVLSFQFRYCKLNPSKYS